ncbi:hypothetical protein OCK74_23375 [Chitinophagaceae bacterium LB-8]|uniref:Uncharacterized protein n=1 Tax=Paraflavisolibacter caeni TaxID=2982496 RepID=A0A9X3B9J0_9BACT|nr:hypothetical protein [Paraflavisolibacter caeni]MCU7552080.1 hypothetical protein [Paraflavisolibacter caeni]
MKKIFIVLVGAALFTACGSHSDQGGVVDDGIGTNDSDGALVDSTGEGWNPATDTTMMEDREDLQKREKIDTSKPKYDTAKSDTGQPAQKPVSY